MAAAEGRWARHGASGAAVGMVVVGPSRLVGTSLGQSAQRPGGQVPPRTATRNSSAAATVGRWCRSSLSFRHLFRVAQPTPFLERALPARVPGPAARKPWRMSGRPHSTAGCGRSRPPGSAPMAAPPHGCQARDALPQQRNSQTAYTPTAAGCAVACQPVGRIGEGGKPANGFEPMAFALQKRCSTAELSRLGVVFNHS